MTLLRAFERLSLYSRVVLVNVGVLVAATLLLSLTPAEVPFPHSVTDIAVIVLGVAVVTGANAMLLRFTFAPLSGLMSAMRALDLLRPGDRLRVFGGVEARQITSTFNEMLDRLEAERLESNRRAHLAREAERRRIGHELHDEIGQRLTAMLLQLERTIVHSPPQTQAELHRTQELARDTLDEVGRLAWQMRPGILDDLGIAKALEALAASVIDNTPASIAVRVQESLPPFGADIEIVLYRVAQEGLTNALRHANAGRISLELAATKTADVMLEIADDGQGFDPTADQGSGLRGMRERALAIGAELSIESAPDAGATVRLTVPGTAKGG